MRLTFTILLFALVATSTAQFGRYFKNRTLRFDYFHSGSFEVEYVMPDEMIVEGKWAGPRKNLIDPFDYGADKIMVYDSVSDKLIFTKGFSSLFIEYQATEEAKSQCGNFPESILMPLPKKTVRLEYYSRGKDMIWVKRYESFINPKKDDFKIKTGNTYPAETILRSGSPKNKLDLIFLPEGYTRAELPEFLEDCSRFTGYLFETDPYGQFIKKVNIRAVIAPSEESGTDNPGDTISRSTLLNSSFYTFGSDRYLMTTDFKKVRDVASSVPYDQIIILVNHPRYGGGGIYNFYAISTVDNENSGFVFTHEFGHSFAGLGDEYSGAGSATEDVYSLDKEPWEPNITTLVNFDAKWKDMLPADTPVPTPPTDEWKKKTGIYEGAGYMEKGVFRPYIDCSMNFIRFNNFCPVCQRAIKEMIVYYTR
ncbi:MAG: IgA Peptidase M64 [Bacteroidales bacterium]|nr:IgA Peptidase M64 [Bacteroidales bacterium]